MPMTALAASRASFGVLASLIPPALPRPPASTWALMTQGAFPAFLRADGSWARDLMTPPVGGTGMPAARNSSLDSYSRSFKARLFYVFSPSGRKNEAGAEADLILEG